MIDLAQDFPIPNFHKSIVTPKGDIYLTGGRRADGEKSEKIYRLDLAARGIVPVGSLKVPRSSHGICYMDGHIYVVGGFTNNQKMTSACERFSLTTQQTQLLAPLNHTASSLCVASFNG